MSDRVEFYTPYLNYKEKGQEGRHRALAAHKNGVDKIPVFVYGFSNNDDNLNEPPENSVCAKMM